VEKLQSSTGMVAFVTLPEAFLSGVITEQGQSRKRGKSSAVSPPPAVGNFANRNAILTGKTQHTASPAFKMREESVSSFFVFE
jgi:hypothetical protein